MTLLRAPAAVAQIFWPLRTYSLPSRRACVRMAPTSEPASGSDHGNGHADLARHQLGQPMALLLFGAFACHIESAENTAAERHHHIGAVAAELFGDDGKVDHTAAGAAIFLGER